MDPTNMSRHVFLPKIFHNAIGLGDPVLTVDDGDTVVTQTIDAWVLMLPGAGRDSAESYDGAVFR